MVCTSLKMLYFLIVSVRLWFINAALQKQHMLNGIYYGYKKYSLYQVIAYLKVKFNGAWSLMYYWHQSMLSDF